MLRLPGGVVSTVRANGTYPLTMMPYAKVSEAWPTTGRHILASYTDEAVLVYQAFNDAIADYAVANQRFDGCDAYLPGRMTWVKTNFLWMMYRCGFGQKDKNQTRVLGIWLKRSSFDEILADASPNPEQSRTRLQWDPDYLPDLTKVGSRRAIQLGIKGRPSFQNGDDILLIEDVTNLARQCQETGEIPCERVYVPSPEIQTSLGMHVA
eukprot:Rhum_TRINITY_DN12276_c0_g1::Rhum_TRINITY_DN12276_c0_g1_i1::g.50642::m.50642